MPDTISPQDRSKLMSKIHSKNTRIDQIVRKWLFSFGYRFRLNDKRYPGTPDIVLPKYKTAIFIHGCFWHAHLNCRIAHIPKSRTDYWINKFQRNTERDRKKIESLEYLGWNVIIVWECELNYDPDLRLIRLLEEIRGVSYDT